MKWSTLSIKVKVLTLVLGIFIIGASLTMLSHSTFVLAKLNEWKLLPQEETFTELYFASYPQDASQVPKGTAVSFSFVIHNLENATTTYPYTVLFIQNDLATTMIDKGTITLANNASTTISEAHTLRRAYEPGQFSVVLPVQGLHVDFYISSASGQ